MYLIFISQTNTGVLHTRPLMGATVAIAPRSRV